MFTGIVEEIGRIKAVSRGAKSSVLTIEGDRIFSDLSLGDSVCVNGVCLTVAGYTENTFTADVMHETLDRSGLGKLQSGSPVNLERAMAADGRFGGHIVSGHIDGTGTIRRVKRDDNAIWYTIEAAPSIMKYIVEKGSIAIDGISLTVAGLTERTFSVSIIPHTARETILGGKKAGDLVNLENDIIGKYVEKLMQPQEQTADGDNGSGGLTLEFLQKAGF
ncbi:MAG: riboflavin synthase [Anaerovoracaceae bacterium]|jgi:riboflavin synthase